MVSADITIYGSNKKVDLETSCSIVLSCYLARIDHGARLCKNRARKGTYRVHVPSKSCKFVFAGLSLRGEIHQFWGEASLCSPLALADKGSFYLASCHNSA